MQLRFNYSVPKYGRIKLDYFIDDEKLQSKELSLLKELVDSKLWSVTFQASHVDDIYVLTCNLDPERDLMNKLEEFIYVYNLVDKCDEWLEAC